jgi:hypothetical protein
VRGLPRRLRRPSAQSLFMPADGPSRRPLATLSSRLAAHPTAAQAQANFPTAAAAAGEDAVGRTRPAGHLDRPIPMCRLAKYASQEFFTEAQRAREYELAG